MARPLKYKTVEELQAAIDAYFTDCKGRPLLDENGVAITDKYGEPVIVDSHPPTVTGMALALGFTGRKQLLDYQGRKTFCNTITRAKARCENTPSSACMTGTARTVPSSVCGAILVGMIRPRRQKKVR